MNCKDTLNSLPDVNRAKIEQMKTTLKEFRERKNASAEKEYICMARGYLACLLDNGTITQSGFRVLLIYITL